MKFKLIEFVEELNKYVCFKDVLVSRSQFSFLFIYESNICLAYLCPKICGTTTEAEQSANKVYDENGGLLKIRYDR